MTAWHLAGIRSTNFVNRPTGIHFHASFKQLKSCCSLFTTLFEHTRSRMDHRFSMGFRPADWAGQVKMGTLFSSNQTFVTLAVCLGSLFCRNVQFTLPKSMSSLANISLSRKSPPSIRLKMPRHLLRTLPTHLSSYRALWSSLTPLPTSNSFLSLGRHMCDHFIRVVFNG